MHGMSAAETIGIMATAPHNKILFILRSRMATGPLCRLLFEYVSPAVMTLFNVIQ